MLLCVIALLLLLPLVARLVKQVAQAQVREFGQSRRSRARRQGELRRRGRGDPDRRRPRGLPVILHAATTAAAALAGAGIATLLRLPAAPLLGAMAGVAMVGLFSTMSWQIPVGRPVAGLLPRRLAARADHHPGRARCAAQQRRTACVVTVALFLVFGLVLAWCLWRFTDLDLHSALLSTAPGGIAQMGVLSAEAKANVPVVLAIHVLR